MKLRSTIAAISCVAIIGAGITWHFVTATRRLAKEVAAYRLGAEHGDAESQFKLGSMYYYGKGVPKDYSEAVRLYRKSAEQGYAKAEFSLSTMYRDGRGVPPDAVEAERWCRKAAEQGDPLAEEGLGYLYYRGEGVAQNLSEAARWYRKSAEQGDGNSQYVLGYMYYYGYGVGQDKGEADRLFRQAAAHGNADARRALGWNTAHLSARSRIMLLLEFLASMIFGIPFLRSGRAHRTRAQMAMGVAALLLVCAVGLDLSWYLYGHLQSTATVTLLYSARHLVRGAVFAVLAFIAYRKSAKAVLIAAAVIFVGLVAFGVTLAEIRHVPVRVWFLYSVGLPVGMAIPSAIFLWLERSEGRQGQSPGLDTEMPLTTK